MPDLANPLDTVRFLSSEIGPRGSTTANERRAADWVAEGLRGLGLTVSVEPFRAVGSFSYAYGILFFLFVLAALVYPLSPLIAVLLCLLSLVVFGLESSSIEVLTRFLPQGESQNVVGELAARGEARRRIVLLAHTDSSKSALLWHPRIVPYFRSIFLLLITTMLVQFVLYLVGLVTGAPWVWPLSVVPAGLMLLAVLIFLDRELRYQHTAGANDNASGVAVMLAVAAQVARDHLNETELTVVATGCEESGPVGILRFLQSHKLERDRTLFINFDNIGAGRVTYVLGEGLLLTLKADAELVSAAKEVVRKNPGLEAQGLVYKMLPTDNTVILTKGYRGLSLMAFDGHGLLPNWHWRTDTVDNVNSATLGCAVELAAGILRRLDGEE